MYLPRDFEQSDRSKVIQLIRNYPFATLITSSASVPLVSHLPLVVEEMDGGVGFQLIGHMARANPHWQDFEKSEVFIIFHGPHRYISPRFYSTDPNVPTWNYAVVHLRGHARLVETKSKFERLREILEKSARLFEGDSENSWTLNLSIPYVSTLMTAIVGFEIEILNIEAKFKLSQNRKDADYQSVMNHLAKSSDLNDQAMLKLMQTKL